MQDIFNKDAHVDFKLVNKPHERKRHNALRFYRSCEGVRQLVINPLKLIPVILLLIVMSLLLLFSHNVISFVVESPPVRVIISFIASYTNDDATITLINQLVNVLYITLIIVVFILVIFELLIVLGKPRRAREKEDDIALALIRHKERDHYKRPFIISERRVENTDLIEFIMYSRWISMEEFKVQETESKILTALKCHRVVEYKYGGINGMNRRIIIIRAGSNPMNSKRGVLIDDEL